ncbi:sulfotransferase family protein [Paraglaciecola aestuariivivens]
MVNLHIIGVQKAGTTALASFLNQHPDIYLVDGKEAHVFDHLLFNQQSNKQAFAEQLYQTKLSKYQNQSIICDATPITMFRPEFIQACYQYNPKAKFIVVLRDPVERAVSQYYMELGRDYEHRNMLMAFLLEPFRLKGINQPPAWDIDSPYRTHSYLSRGCYHKQLKQLFAIVPKEQVWVVHQQELKNQHNQTLNNIFNFLGLANQCIPSKQVFVSEKPKHCKTEFLARLYARLYFILRRETPKRWQQTIDA